MRRLVAVLALLTAFVLIGCAGNSGPKRYRVSGKVTYDGQPILFGDVLITPDGGKKNTGPQGIAPIRDGKFDTSATGGKGYGGGPAVIRVTGFDREGGKLLCEREFAVDLPVVDATSDIAVPKGKPTGPKSDI